MAGDPLAPAGGTDTLERQPGAVAGAAAKLDRYIGYYGPYYDSHEALDKDFAVQEEARNVARSVVQAVKVLRAGLLSQPDRQLESPRTK